MTFLETIGQHFRHTQISGQFATTARAEPHVMGIGAIAAPSIETVATGIARENLG
jgi:hypothetical protein